MLRDLPSRLVHHIHVVFHPMPSDEPAMVKDTDCEEVQRVALSIAVQHRYQQLDARCCLVLLACRASRMQEL